MFQSYVPCEALTPYVVDLWAYECRRSADPASPPPALSRLPDTTSCACFLWGDGVTAHHGRSRYTTRSGLSGFQRERIELSGHGDVCGITVRFTPWGAGHFLPAPASAFADTRTDYRAVYGHARIETLEDQLFGAADAPARVQCVERFLLEQLREPVVDALVREASLAILAQGGLSSVSALARRFEVSERTLERRFKQVVGASPKRMGRVVRMQEALRRYRPGMGWAEVAAATGYADQAHLIHDCQALCGASPHALVTAAASAFRPPAGASAFSYPLVL